MSGPRTTVVLVAFSARTILPSPSLPLLVALVGLCVIGLVTRHSS